MNRRRVFFLKPANLQSVPPKKILIIKLRAVGDLILATPVFANLRRIYPDAQIDLLVEPAPAALIAGNPSISSMLIYDRRRESSIALIRRIRKNKYRLVIDLFCNPRTALITFLSGARVRTGFPFLGRTYAYNVPAAIRSAHVHNVEFNLDALRALHLPVENVMPEIFLDEESLQTAMEWKKRETSGRSFLVALNTGGGWEAKRWGLEKFAGLGDMITRKFGAEVILPWGPGEKESVESIQKMMKEKSIILPPTSLPQLAACLKLCSFVVSNDSGPMHIAAALGVPTLGIFGPVNPHLQGPYGARHRVVRNEKLPCLGCNLISCPIGNVCMTGLDVETVFHSFRLLFKNSHTSVHES